MEIIWTNEVRLVKDYTDHGEEHSKRVAEYVEKLLQVNSDMKFSEQEIFLLLAGVYLHDIRMQCDVVKYSEIKTKAKKLGANFTVKFKAKTTNSYSDEEQGEIRDNHHYLSAAWIEYLYEGNDSVLSPLIKRIPYVLVKDSMDVCQFHSKLQIKDCSESFIGDPNSRKRLIASILRFADELDIDGKRANINTVKIHSIGIKNSIHWWYHYCTEVHFIDNKILLKVNLHPNDFKLLGSLMRRRITNFKIKNKPIIDVLVKHKILIEIDDKSDVVEDSCAPIFPSDIIDAIFNESTDKTSFSKTVSTCHRRLIKEYKGDGFLKSEDGTELPCEFDTVQLEDGEITLICNCSISDLDIQRYFPELNLENTSPVELKFLMA